MVHLSRAREAIDPVSKYFWVNISDKRFEIPGVIEFSNLRPLGETIVYVPFYMPQSNPKFGAPDEAFIKESMECLKAINPTLTDADRIDYITRHLQVCRQAMAEGVPLKGYFTWSLLDNFEWSLGYDKRFGLVHVDFDTLARRPKESWHQLRAALVGNG